MTKFNALLIVGGIVVLIPTLYFASCSVVSTQRARAFEHVKVGDTESQVIEAMGTPTDQETAGGPQLIKYGGPECKAPCAQRLWYPNNMDLTGEIWFVDIDAGGHVVHTAHMTSP